MLYTRQPPADVEKAERASGAPRCRLQSRPAQPSRQKHAPLGWQSPCAHGAHGRLQSSPVQPASQVQVPSDRHVPWVASHGRQSVSSRVSQFTPAQPKSHMHLPFTALQWPCEHGSHAVKQSSPAQEIPVSSV